MGYILCQAQGGINDIACQIWLCTDYEHNREIILTHWSYFGSDLFDIFDFKNYPVSVHPVAHLKSISYDAVEPPEEDYVKLFADKLDNISDISKRVKDFGVVFNKSREYPDSTLLLHDSCGGGSESVNFFINVDFTQKFKAFFKEKSASFPADYNALHIRHTDMKVDAETLLNHIHLLGTDPLFIGTDDVVLKTRILQKFKHAFSSDPQNNEGSNLHYKPNKEILESALVDLFVMVFSKNTIRNFYDEANVEVISGFCRLIDSLKEFKNDIFFKLNGVGLSSFAELF